MSTTREVFKAIPLGLLLVLSSAADPVTSAGERVLLHTAADAGALLDRDIAVVAVPSPQTLTPPLEAVIPVSELRNTGTQVARDFKVYMEISPGAYVESTSVESLLPDSTIHVHYRYWVAGNAGTAYHARTRVNWNVDEEPGNDTLSKEIYAWDDRWYIHSSWCQDASRLLLDGIIDTVDEWGDATRRDVSDFLGRASPYPRAPGSALLYVMNDSLSLYVALSGVCDPVQSRGDVWSLCFEDGFDRLWPCWPDSGEGRIDFDYGGNEPVFQFLPLFSDTSCQPYSVTLEGRACPVPGHLQCELIVPLGDTVLCSDTTGRHATLLAEPGDTAGFWTTAGDAFEGEDFVWWPTSSVTGHGELSDMGMIILHPGPACRGDVAVTAILSPPDTVKVDSIYGVTAVIACSGAPVEDFWFHCCIGDSVSHAYRDSLMISGLAPGSQLGISFEDWHVVDMPFDPVICFSANVEDSDAGNNSLCKELHLSGVGVSESFSMTRPGEFRFSQNAPNPFRGETIIALNLDFGYHVKLDIVDAAGRIVTILLDEEVGPGLYCIRWDGRDRSGRDLPCGIYFARLTADGCSQIRKLTKLE